MDKISIITNNKLVPEFFQGVKDRLDIRFIGAPGMEIIKHARLAVNAGFVLLSNPLSGVRRQSVLFSPRNTPPASRKPQQKVVQLNPYLSIIISGPQEMIDFRSIKELEEARELYNKNAKLRHQAHADESVKAFMQADLEAIRTTMATLAGQA